MLKSRRTFLQGAAALLASLPFAGQLFASVPPAKPKLFTPPVTLAEILQRAKHLYLTNGEWYRRCNWAATKSIESLQYRPLPAFSFGSMYNTIIDMFVFGNAFPYQRVDGHVGLFDPEDIELKWNQAAGRLLDVEHKVFPFYVGEIARRPATHIRLTPTICGLKTIGWGIPHYYDVSRPMPTVLDLLENFDQHGKPALQRFFDRLS